MQLTILFVFGIKGLGFSKSKLGQVSESDVEVSKSGGWQVSESEGLEVSEFDVEVSESRGRRVSESEGLRVSESDVEVSESDVGQGRGEERRGVDE